MDSSFSDSWAAALLADDSDTNLLIWADWLEEQGDPACEGVRQLLVPHQLRPEREVRGFLQPITLFRWSREKLGNLRLRRATYHRLDVLYSNVNSDAEAHYRALYDVAAGYAARKEQHPAWKSPLA
jgi:uncharacterized protein (TIGR02996 family)